MAEKTIASKSGHVMFDGIEGVKVAIAPLLETCDSAEPTGKALLVLNQRKVVTLHDAKDENGNPRVLTVTLRAEVSPETQAQAERILNKRQQTETNKEKKEAKEHAANQRLIDAVQTTAIKVAQSNVAASASADPVALAFRIAQGMTGTKALNPGQ